YGIYTAASKYFGKVPEQLTLAECAMLAGIVRSPSYYDPYKIPQEVQERRNIVLRKMEQQGYITNEEAVAAMNESITLAPPNVMNAQRQAPYFCDYITDLVRRTYGDQAAFRGGLRINTTIDLNLQHMAENVLARALKPNSGPDAAIVCIDPRTGYLKAMVGGKNYATSQFNLAAQGHRQAGSAFKVFVLSRAIADGVSPERTYDSSSPRTINLPEGGKWVVNNYAGRGSGSMTLRSATIHSVNCVYAQLIMDVGPSRVRELARQMGIQTDFDDNPAIALGGLSTGVTPLEMASAFGTLANNGIHAVPRSIYKVTDASGNVIAENKPETHAVLDTKVAAKLNDLLEEVVSSGTGRGASIGRPQAGKTGTTENHADAWFVGYTPDLVTAVWVGYPQGSISMGGMAGGDLPADIWAAFMRQALKNTPPTDFTKPDKDYGDEHEEQPARQPDTISVTVCDESGLLATPNCPHTHSQEFRLGQEPTTFCNIHKYRPSNIVPNVVGMRKSTAVTTLQQSGFQVSVVDEPSNERLAGTVISQTPPAGTRLTAGLSVTISVASGAIQRSVPNVVWMTEPAARGSIVAAGFTPSVSYTSGTQNYVVVGGSPGPGTKLPVGSTFSITVSKTGG
ncbi:MAG: PASTA domain-containing protein, partial [Actinobacteria bacterium]|nr:PASTA domain-containing protein [Actinomycetota bacterium]